MAIAKMTLIGMMNYLSDENDDLFAEMRLPAELDKDTVIGSIMMRGGEFPVIWANPYFVQKMIGLWSKKVKPTIEDWVKTNSIEYDPLHNYDRYEEYTDKETNTGNADGTNLHTVTGYDSDNLVTNDQVRNTTNAKNDRDFEHKAHLYGNIGVTTSQQMKRDELELARDYNIYNMIAELFVEEFCVGVY